MITKQNKIETKVKNIVILKNMNLVGLKTISNVNTHTPMDMCVKCVHACTNTYTHTHTLLVLSLKRGAMEGEGDAPIHSQREREEQTFSWVLIT